MGEKHQLAEGCKSVLPSKDVDLQFRNVATVRSKQGGGGESRTGGAVRRGCGVEQRAEAAVDFFSTCVRR